MSSNLWKWTGINTAALLAVLLLAYSAGAGGGGLGIEDFGALPQAAGFRLLGAAFIAVAASVALVIQLSSRVLRPVEQLTEYSERLEAGDYSTPVQINSGDEFTLVAERYNQVAGMAERTAASDASQQALERTMSELADLAAEVGRGDLFRRAPITADASATLSEATNRMLENLSRLADKIHDCGSEVGSNARQGLSSAESSSGSAMRQQQELASFSASVDKFASALRETLTGAETALLASRRALEVAEESGQALTAAAAGATRIRAAMSAASEHIKTLGERSLKVYEVINIINETHLMALSATMEASRAAQSGNGLAVLDAELRKMGEHSRKSTQSVVTLLQSIHAEANEAAAIVEQASRMAEAGALGTEQAVQVFSQVSSSLEQSAARSESVVEESQSRVQDAQALAASLQNTLRISRQGSESSQKAVAAVEQLVRSTIQLHEAVSRMRTTPALKAEALAAEIAAAAASSQQHTPLGLS
ncbi:MAG: methyl-accepting chemotaxis protein [Candidatus Korobacteraceae bacterium]